MDSALADLQFGEIGAVGKLEVLFVRKVQQAHEHDWDREALDALLGYERGDV